jgi:hypothetical protein
MTAPVDRDREELAAALAEALTGVDLSGIPPSHLEAAHLAVALMPTIAAELARVQAAANQRIYEALEPVRQAVDGNAHEMSPLAARIVRRSILNAAAALAQPAQTEDAGR